MAQPDGPDTRARIWRMAALAPVLLAAAFALLLVHTAPFPGPDELEHVSYAAYLQESGRWLPRFEHQTDLVRDDLRTWSDRVNYIGHPSPYYLWVAEFLDRQLPMGQAVARVRLASLALLLAGLVLAATAGAFRGVAALAFAAGVAWCPQVLTVAAQVSNDALAILAGGLAYWGLLRQRSWAVGAALMLALWAKPNAGLELGLFAGFAWLLDPARGWRGFAALLAGSAAGALPTIPVLLRYGSVVPVAAETVWPVRSMGSFAEYWPVFLANVGQSWGWMTFGVWPMDGMGWARSAACWALLGAALAGAVLGLRQGSAPAGVNGRVAAAAVLAFCVVLPLHLAFASGRLGFSVPAAGFRYYLALWPGLMHAVIHAASRSNGARAAVLLLAAAAFALGWGA